MLAGMVARGHSVLAMAPNTDDHTPAQLGALGVAFQAAPIDRTGMNPLRDMRDLVRLARALRAADPDLILAYTIKPVIYGTLAAWLAGIPSRHVMITGRGSSLQGRSLRDRCLLLLITGLYRLALGKVKGVFFQNKDDHQFFLDNHLLPASTPCTLINGSGVDLDYYREYPQPVGNPIVLMVSRVMRDKGVLEFVEAARQVRAQLPAARFQLLGPIDSNPTALSAKQVQQWVDEGTIEYLGTTHDVRPYIQDAHLVVLPSYSEGTPRSLLEAMAMGRPIVTTLAPGCNTTVVPGRNGRMVPVRDDKALAEAIADLLKNPAVLVRMGKESRQLAEEKFNVHDVNEVIFRALGV